MIVAVALAALGTGLGVYFRSALWRRVITHREATFLRQAEAAYRSGEIRAGDLAARSALELSPSNPQAKLLRARWLLRLGQRTAGMAAWAELLAEPKPENKRRYSLMCASQLLEGAAWAELRQLALGQLITGPSPDQSLWINLAAECCRVLARGPTAEESAQLRQPHLATALLAYSAVSRAERDDARTALRALPPAALPHAVAVLTARAWLRLGDPAAARAAVNHSRRQRDALEATALDFLFPPEDPLLERTAVYQMLAGTTSALDVRRRIGLMVTFGLPQASRTVATTLYAELQPQESRLDAETLASLWAYSGIAGADSAETFWRQRLEARVGVTLPRLPAGALNPRLFGVIAERTPMTIEIVCSLMSTMPENAAAAP